MTKQVISSGLEQVVAAETCLSHVDGAAGELIVAGWPLAELVARHDYSAAAALLWQPFVPGDADTVRRQLGLGRLRAWHALLPYAERLRALPALEALRLGLDLSADDPELADPAGVSATLLSAFAHHLGSRRAPDPGCEPIADLLAQIGQAAGPEQTRALTAYLVCVCDHGLNASTFTARVIASTGSDLRSSIAGALGALKGPLHGGAPGPVLDMLDAIGEAERAPAWIAAELAAGRRIMGFGHRIYRVRDPRADVLRAALEAFQAAKPTATNRLASAGLIESLIQEALQRHKPGRVLDTNVEYYTALLLEALGFERSCFTAVFALGRVLGWLAHALEQAREGRLIRPQSHYIGPKIEINSN